MRAAMVIWLVVVGCAAVALPARGDVVVMTNRQYYEGTVTDVTEDMLVLKTEYGAQELSRSRVTDYFQTVIGKAGEEYYRAGLTMLQLGDVAKAQQLFDKAGKFNPAYADAGSQAIARATSSGTIAGPSVTVVQQPQPNYQTVQLQCTICEGTGRVESGGGLSRGEGREGRVTYVTCPVCGGRGHKILRLKPGYGTCPECGGMGTTGGDSSGSGGGDNSMMVAKRYPPCRRCGASGTLLLRRGGEPSGGGTMGVGTRYGGTSMPSGAPPRPPTPSEEETSEEETESEEPAEEEEEGSWFTRNLRWVLILGGLGLLGVVLVVSKMGSK